MTGKMVVTFRDPDKVMQQLPAVHKLQISENMLKKICLFYYSASRESLPPMLLSHFLEKDKGDQAVVLLGKCIYQDHGAAE